MHYIARAGLRSASEKYSRGLTILKGAVPDRTRGSGHMAPTYFCRFPGSSSDGSGGSALSFFVMAGLVPAIHVLLDAKRRRGCAGQAAHDGVICPIPSPN